MTVDVLLPPQMSAMQDRTPQQSESKVQTEPADLHVAADPPPLPAPPTELPQVLALQSRRPQQSKLDVQVAPAV